MRISDWSSDVCSSDLHGHLARGRLDRIEVDQRLAQRLVDRAIPHVLAHQPVVEITPADPETPGFAPPVGRDRDRDVQTHQRPDVGGDEAVGAHDLDRSEEHTSELQSLMRISYAVFCLKKKIKNTQTRITRHK